MPGRMLLPRGLAFIRWHMKCLPGLISIKRGWLEIRASCATDPELQEPIKDPARFLWHEVTKVQHYWLDVNAVKQPMDIEEDIPYSRGTGRS